MAEQATTRNRYQVDPRQVLGEGIGSLRPTPTPAPAPAPTPTPAPGPAPTPTPAPTGTIAYAGGPLDIAALLTNPNTGQPLTGSARERALNQLSSFQKNVEAGKTASLRVGGATYSYRPSYGEVTDLTFTSGGQAFDDVQSIIRNQPSGPAPAPGAAPTPTPGEIQYPTVPTVVNPAGRSGRAGTLQETIARESPEREAAGLGLFQSAKAFVDQPLNLPEYRVAGLTQEQQNLIQAGQAGIGDYLPYVTEAKTGLEEAMDATRGVSIADVGGISATDVTSPSLAAAKSTFAPSLTAFQATAPGAVSAGSAGASTISGARTDFRPELTAFQMGTPSQIQEERVGQGIGALTAAQAGPSERVATQSFIAPGTAESYMSPYIQSVLQSQIAEARRADEIARQSRAAQAVAAGAFGGTRQAVQESEAARNLARLEADIMAQGLQSAYTTAQQQFNAEEQARLAAQQANQAAGLQTSLANLSAEQQARVTNQAALLQAQGMNQEAALRAALSNQQAQLTAGQQNLAAQLATQELGTQAGLQAALANLNAEQQARVANQAAQLQASGMNQEAALRAALSNQQAELTISQQNLASQLATQELGANVGLQTSLANLNAEQQANVQRAALDLQAQGMNQQAALEAALANQRTEAALATSRGELGLQSAQLLGQQSAALGELGALGQNMSQQGTQFGIGLGEIERGVAQQTLDAQRATELQQATEPLQRIAFATDILQRTPSSQSTLTAVSAPQPSVGQQILGGGIAALSGAAAAKTVGGI